MKIRLLLPFTLALFLLASLPARALDKWLYYPTNLLVDKNVDDLETIWRRAAAAGYTKVLLTDSKFGDCSSGIDFE